MQERNDGSTTVSLVSTPATEVINTPGIIQSVQASPILRISVLENVIANPMPVVSPRQAPIAQSSLALNMVDLELLHNFNISTACSLDNVPCLQTFLRVNVPRLAFSNPYLMHTILAVSALHMSRFKTGSQSAVYTSYANNHFNIAIGAAAKILSNITDENCHALYMFGSLSSIFMLAKGPRQGDYLVFGGEEMTEWMTVWRGLKISTISHWDVLQKGTLAPLFQISSRQISSHPVAENNHLRDLREMIVSYVPPTDPDLEIQLAALDELALSFVGPAGGALKEQPTLAVVFKWLYQLSDEYEDSLRRRKPISLVIYAHFCVLLNELSAFWWIKGWPLHLIAGIYGMLSDEYRLWIQWPMEEIGWIPN